MYSASRMRERQSDYSQYPYTLQPRLTQIALAVQPRGLIADRVMPRYTAPGVLFAYSTDQVGEALRLQNTRLGGTARAQQFEVGSSDSEARSLPWGIEGLIPIEEIRAHMDQGALIDPMAQATVRGTNYVRMQREARVRDLVAADASYPADNIQTLASASVRWNGTGDARSQILSAAESMLVPPNILVCNSEVWLALRQNPSIVESIHHTGAGADAEGAASRQAVAELLDLDDIVVGRTKYNSAKPGQTATYHRLWSKDSASLLHVEQSVMSVTDGDPTWGFTGVWDDLHVISWDQPGGYEGVRCVKPVEHLVEVVAFSACGYKFKTPIG